MRIVNKMVGKPSPLFSTKAQILLPVARPCTVSPSPGLLLGCRPLNDINDGWPVGRRPATTAITLPGEYNYLAPPTVSTLRCTRQPLLHHPLCRVKPRYDKFKILRLPPAAAAAARQPSMPWQEWFITALPAQAGAGLVRGCSAGDKLREPASVNTGSEKAKGWKPTEIAKAYFDI